MNTYLERSTKYLNLTNDIKKDWFNYCIHNDQYDLAVHSLEVADEVCKLAKKYHIKENKAYTAALLHDAGRLYSEQQLLFIANQNNIELSEEEMEHPYLIHQRVSKIIAKEIFEIDDCEILSAIECHETLNRECSKLALILFIADKLHYPYDIESNILSRMNKMKYRSLKKTALIFIKYYLNQKDINHPWMLAAYRNLK